MESHLLWHKFALCCGLATYTHLYTMQPEV